MSKEQAIRFMLLKDKDEELIRKYQGIMNKHEGENLTEEEQEKIILEEVIPLAKSMGFEFSSGDFQELFRPVNKQLTDEELQEAVGGRGQFVEYWLVRDWGKAGAVYSCEFAPDDETFKMYYDSFGHDCPNFALSEYSVVMHVLCANCKHLKIGRI